MSDEPNRPDVLAILYDRLKDLQSQAVAIRDRVEEVELIIAAIERAGRKRPGPKPRVVRLSEVPPASSTEPTDAA